MSKKLKKNRKDFEQAGFIFVKKYKDIFHYILKSNGMTVVYKQIPGTGVVTSNITYKVGSKDERAGETGLAHMLEHMLFKPTKHDLARKIDSGAMQFERETGCILNANTGKERTTYFFNYPTEHFSRALQIEAERMTDVVLTNKEFLPERNNVLSEFDMYNGDPSFALSVQMVCVAYQSHPHGHETIGFREDIEKYTPEKLQTFYKNYYRPDNATLTIVGDINIDDALIKVKKIFGALTNPKTPIPRHETVEPKQEGVRRVTITRPSDTNIVALGIKHAGFPSRSWFETSVLLSILTDGQDSILQKDFIDKGLVTKIDVAIEPTSEENLAIIFITLANGQKPEDIEHKVLKCISSLKTVDIQKLLTKEVQQTLTSELFGRSSSLKIAMELTEYIASDALDVYYKTEDILKKITVKQMLDLAKSLFVIDKMTIGYFIGKK
jgi:predicted Zn-dependent peptidase